MGKTVRNNPGYSFPRMPDEWGERERQFGLGLRDQFDQLFVKDENNSEQIKKSQTALEEVKREIQLNVNDLAKRIADLEYRLSAIISESDATIEEQIAEINEEIESIERTMAADKQELLTRIGTLYNEVYPIGITVFGNSALASPITFGTWEAENTDPQTGDPVPDEYGHYMWRRVADPS